MDRGDRPRLPHLRDALGFDPEESFLRTDSPYQRSPRPRSASQSRPTTASSTRLPPPDTLSHYGETHDDGHHSLRQFARSIEVGAEQHYLSRPSTSASSSGRNQALATAERGERTYQPTEDTASRLNLPEFMARLSPPSPRASSPGSSFVLGELQSSRSLSHFGSRGRLTIDGEGEQAERFIARAYTSSRQMDRFAGDNSQRVTTWHQHIRPPDEYPSLRFGHEMKEMSALPPLVPSWHRHARHSSSPHLSPLDEDGQDNPTLAHPYLGTAGHFQAAANDGWSDPSHPDASQFAHCGLLDASFQGLQNHHPGPSHGGTHDTAYPPPLPPLDLRASYQPNSLTVPANANQADYPFHCEVCGRGFSRRSTCAVHMNTHTGEKPHVCPICSRPFSVASNLRRHMKRHDQS